VPINSPLKPIFQDTVAKIVESGMMDYIVSDWQGKGIPNYSASELMILSFGQVILVFLVVAGMFGISACIFCAEMGRKKIEQFKLAKKTKQTSNRKKRHIPKDLLRYPENTKWDSLPH
jgi:hypothetical protein